MGELLLCNEPIASLPYYIEGISWNIYSLEELCYYIENNTYLLEREFMTEELCVWIEKEMKHAELAEKLKNILQGNGQLSDFVLAILMESGYCPLESVREIVRTLHEMEEKSDFECNKIRADRLMEKEKYLSSIYEYKRLLDSNDAGEQPDELLGSIWHNLGTAYASLYLFGEASDCYEKAYYLNHREESIRECLCAYRCQKDEAGFSDIVKKYQVPEELLRGLENEILMVTENEKLEEFRKKIDALSVMAQNGKKSEYQKQISKMIFQWKEEYRRICRI